MFLNACRQVILLIPFLIIMPRFFDLQGVFMAQPLADIGSGIIGILLLRWQFKKMQ
jgi:Na+-driven multidrug efflux pump